MPDFHEPDSQPTKVDRLQYYKDELLKAGIITNTQNQRIQARLDRLAVPVKSQWNRPREVKGLPRG
jgi:predicted HAD superfamily phosphohydrolase YqeG